MAEREIVVVGAGLGAVRVCQQLRRHGHNGSITVVGGESHHPYDRPPLSKQVMRGQRDSTTFDKLDQLNIRWALGSRASAVDTAGGKVVTAGGGIFAYDSLVLAPGGRARLLPGLEVGAGVHVLRTIDDALSIRASVKANGRIIVIGAGFIGCEIAASARELGCEVDLVEALSAPLIRVLGSVAASKMRDLHETHGVRLHLGVTVDDVIRDSTGRVAGVTLSNGNTIDGTDIVVGIGISADTAWLAPSGVEIDDGIVCDSRGRTNKPNVFAVGDAARWWHPLVGAHKRIEHWTTTADQAAVVAAAITAEDANSTPELSAAPYFWSDQYDTKIQGIGFIDANDRVHELSVRDRTVLLYSHADVLRGIVGFSIPSAVMRTKALIERSAPVKEAIDLLTS